MRGARRKSTGALPFQNDAILLAEEAALMRSKYTSRRSSDPLAGIVNAATKIANMTSSGGHSKAGRKHSEPMDRIYIKEGRILLYCGSNEQERYLFLFSDLLLVAKEKAQASYRLKEKVRLTDIWLDDQLNLQEISNCVRNPQNCFVIGWPVKNYVVEFGDKEERNAWFRILTSQIRSLKARERPTKTKLIVKYKQEKKFVARELTIENTQSSSELAWLVAKSFDLVQELPPLITADHNNPQQQPNSSAKKLDPHSIPQCPYSLYVQCGKEPLFQLKGHECVFAILLYYVRDLIPANQDDSDFLDLSLIEDLASSNVNFKCSFFLKLRQTTTPSKHKLSKKAPKRHSSSHALLNQSASSSSVAAFGNLRRKVMKQISHDSLATTTTNHNNASRWSVSSGSAYSSPDPAYYQQQQRRTSLAPGSGRLFARPLSDLVDNADENVVPGSVLDIIKTVFRDGLYLEGIFRKPPNHRICREIREKLDSGQQVNFYDVQPTVAASLLKEFLRLLPDSLLISSEFSYWLQLCDERDVSVRIEKAKELLTRLPKPNYELLRHLMCLLYHVMNNQSTNQMNSYNLSVCIAPSLLNNAFTHLIGDINGFKAAEIVQFLIENAIELFGLATLGLLGEVPIDHSLDEVSSSREAAGSTDSLLSSSGGDVRSYNRPIDSGLSSEETGGINGKSSPSDGHVTPASAPVVVGGDSTIAGSVIHLFLKSPSFKSPPTSTFQGAGVEFSFEDSWTSEKFSGNENAGGCEKFAAAASSQRRPMTSSSVDSLYDSVDSACSYDDSTTTTTAANENRATNFRPANQNLQQTLIRSESGQRLVSLVLDSQVSCVQRRRSKSRRDETAKFLTPTTSNKEQLSPTTSYHATVDRRHAFRQKFRRSPPTAARSCNHNTVGDSGHATTDLSGDETQPVAPPRIKKQSTIGDAPQNGTKPVAATTVIFDSNDEPSPAPRDAIDRPSAKSVAPAACVFQAQPVLIRCNSSGSSSSGGENETDAVEKNLASTQRFAARVVAPSAATSSTPTSTSRDSILRNLDEIRRRVCDAQLRQRSALTSALNGGRTTTSAAVTSAPAQPQTLYDSSTVTEASSEETTPHVSRESSRANDFRNVAAAMFERQQEPPVHVPLYANVRPKPFHSKFAGTDSMLKYSKTPIQEQRATKMPLSATLLLNARNNIRPLAPDFKQQKENFACPSSASSTSINKRWRRKTLGGDDYSNLQSQILAKCSNNNRPSLQYSNQKSVDLQQEFQPLTNIVKDRLTFFNNNNSYNTYSNPCSPSHHVSLERCGRSMTSSAILQQKSTTPQQLVYTSRQIRRPTAGRSTSCQRKSIGEVSYV